MAGIGLREGEVVIVVDDFGDGDREDSRLSVRILSPPAVRGCKSAVFYGQVERAAGDSFKVAVKVVHVHNDDDASGSQCLIRELAMVRRTARHNLVVPFLGAALSVDQLVLVSPWMCNGNLADWLLKEQPHSSSHRLFLMLQVADAACYLHDDLRIVHGDLKCENVLVSDQENALLTDFGLCTFIDKRDSEATTQTDIRDQNTLRFAAPELLIGEARSSSNQIRSKTPASDIYAFGMLVLQAYTGKKPWPDYSKYEVVAQVLHHRHMHPRPLNDSSGLTDALWGICVSCWQWNPAGRPSMSQVLNDLAMMSSVDHVEDRAEEPRVLQNCFCLPTSPRTATTNRSLALVMLVLVISLGAAGVYFDLVRGSPSNLASINCPTTRNGYADSHDRLIPKSPRGRSGRGQRTTWTMEELISARNTALGSAAVDDRQLPRFTGGRRGTNRTGCVTDELGSARNATICFSLEPGSRRNYDLHLKSYRDFCARHALPEDPTPETLSLYAAYEARYISAHSVRTYLSGLTHALEPFYPDVRANRASDLVRDTVAGCIKLASPATPQVHALRSSSLFSAAAADASENPAHRPLSETCPMASLALSFRLSEDARPMLCSEGSEHLGQSVASFSDAGF